MEAMTCPGAMEYLMLGQRCAQACGRVGSHHTSLGLVRLFISRDVQTWTLLPNPTYFGSL